MTLVEHISSFSIPPWPVQGDQLSKVFDWDEGKERKKIKKLALFPEIEGSVIDTESQPRQFRQKSELAPNPGKFEIVFWRFPTKIRVQFQNH